MESILHFSTVENPMNCRVFKVNLIEKLEIGKFYNFWTIWSVIRIRTINHPIFIKIESLFKFTMQQFKCNNSIFVLDTFVNTFTVAIHLILRGIALGK